ncbi:MAG TPA: hypothetical protein VIU82_22045 [Bosea sp. (in: a-proteobacteria)]
MSEMIERIAKAMMAAAYEAMGRPTMVHDPKVGDRMEIAGVDVRMLARVAAEEMFKDDAKRFAASIMEIGRTTNPLLDDVPMAESLTGTYRYERKGDLP